MTLVTEVDVLTAARDQIKKGYTDNFYVAVRNGDEEPAESAADFNRLIKQPDHYAVVCAIGGVEHALYSLTKRFITGGVRDTWSQIGGDHEQDYIDAYGGKSADEIDKIKSDTTKLYAKCLYRLNKIAKKMGYADVEEPNTSFSVEKSKPIVLEIYRKAIRQARDEQKKQIDKELNDLLASAVPTRQRVSA